MELLETGMEVLVSDHYIRATNRTEKGRNENLRVELVLVKVCFIHLS